MNINLNDTKINEYTNSVGNYFQSDQYNSLITYLYWVFFFLIFQLQIIYIK